MCRLYWYPDYFDIQGQGQGLVHLTSWILCVTHSMNIVWPDWQYTIDFDTLISQKPFTVLYFYPKDNTPWCTLQAHDFNRLLPEYEAKQCQIVWVSKDTWISHQKFISSCDLQIPLISDDGTLHERFDTRWTKSMYGKSYQWTVRSTFIIDQQGTIIKEYRNVSVPHHAEKVLADIPHA